MNVNDKAAREARLTKAHLTAAQIKAGFSMQEMYAPPNPHGENYVLLVLNAKPKDYARSVDFLVSIDWKQRCYRSGFSTTGSPMYAPDARGRGWRKRLIESATAWLQELVR